MSFWDAINIFRRLSNLEVSVSKLDDQQKILKTDLDAVTADLATAITGIAGLQTSITTLNQTVADLQAQLASAGLTPEQQAAMDALVAEADSAKTQADTLAANFPPKAS